MVDLVEAAARVRAAPTWTWWSSTTRSSPRQGVESELPLWPGDDPLWAAWARDRRLAALEAGLRFRPVDDTVAATLAHTDVVPGIGLEPEREAELLAAWHAR